DILSRVFLDILVAAGMSFFIFTPKKGTNNQSRERVVISTKYFRTKKPDDFKIIRFFVYYPH
ncbi:MAG TPA: hypothetical protein DIC25_04530, partial [Weissella cibaria]|nr:hypothetical protein [Weissella cibaria]